MTPKSNPHDADVRQRCMLYLLGELSGDQATTFEHELGSSEALQAELLAQSEVMCGLITGAAPTPVTATPVTPTYYSWQSVAAIAALAACLMITFLSWPTETANDEPVVASTQPEGLLIAQAWADVSVTSAALVAPIEPDEFLELETESDDDSSFSWMVTAMEAGAALDG